VLLEGSVGQGFPGTVGPFPLVQLHHLVSWEHWPHEVHHLVAVARFTVTLGTQPFTP
jgi:hypothetical protein